LRHVEPARRLGHVLGLGEHDEPLQLIDGHAASIGAFIHLCIK